MATKEHKERRKTDGTKVAAVGQAFQLLCRNHRYGGQNKTSRLLLASCLRNGRTRFGLRREAQRHAALGAREMSESAKVIVRSKAVSRLSPCHRSPKRQTSSYAIGFLQSSFPVPPLRDSLDFPVRCSRSLPAANPTTEFRLASLPFGNSDLESQRDSGLQPRVARHELPWENRPQNPQPQRGCGVLKTNNTRSCSDWGRSGFIWDDLLWFVLPTYSRKVLKLSFP